MDNPSPSPPPVTGFKGINNRMDPTRLGLAYQLEAVNVLCDDAGYLTRRPGVQQVASGYADMHATRNGRLLLVTTAGTLVERFADGTETVLADGLLGAPFQWVEVGTALLVQGGGHQWAIYPDRVIPWGSLCPTPEAQYPAIETLAYPPPQGNLLGVRRDQVVVAVWEPERDRSVLYFSRPGYPHEFLLDRDYVLLPGKVTLIVGVAQGLVIGTDRAIYSDPIDAPLQREADYGVPLNALAFDDRNRVYFWSDRGLCRALPFENMTDAALVPTRRRRLAAGLLPFQGSTYCVVQQTGEPSPAAFSRAFQPLPISATSLQGVTHA